MADATARVWEQRERFFVERAHAARKAFAPYNTTVTLERVTHGPAHAATVLVPAVGCLVGYNDSGYGDCSTSTWQVVHVGRSRPKKHHKAREVVRIDVRPLCGIDIGVGDADAMPGHPGECAYDPDRPTLTLTLMWTLLGADSDAQWKQRTEHGWDNAHWSMGQYTPSSMGIDK